MPARIEVPFRLCKNCKLPMMRKRYSDGRLETPSHYARRKVCGNRCKGEAYRKIVYVSRPCKQCGYSLLRKVLPCGRIEDPKNLRRRKFCDAECAALWFDEHGMRPQAALMWAKVGGGRMSVNARLTRDQDAVATHARAEGSKSRGATFPPPLRTITNPLPPAMCSTCTEDAVTACPCHEDAMCANCAEGHVRDMRRMG